MQQAGLDYESAEVSFVPEYTQEVDAPTAEKLIKIIDALEDSDDVQNVYANFEAPDECPMPASESSRRAVATPVQVYGGRACRRRVGGRSAAKVRTSVRFGHATRGSVCACSESTQASRAVGLVSLTGCQDADRT